MSVTESVPSGRDEERPTEERPPSDRNSRDLEHREQHAQRHDADRPLVRKLAVEFVGTFILVFTVSTATARGGAGPLAPVAIGLALMVMVFAGGHISGAHYNPAVTLAVLIRRRIPIQEALLYVASQLTAAALAGLLGRGIDGPQALATVGSTWKMLAVELLFTFVLAYVVLNVAIAKDTQGNSFYGLAIGLTVTTGALAVGRISGGAFNPAVAFGSSIGGSFSWAHIWIYALSELAGGAAAAGAFGFLLPRTAPSTSVQSRD
jgi:aquaporin Z